MGIKIVCVNAGNYLGRGSEYVNKLFDSVMRNLPGTVALDFICFTDSPEGLCEGIRARPLRGGLTGWWNKLYLFKKGVFEDNDRVIYFDLDTVITGPLDALLEYVGRFAILRDFYRPGGLQSSVMLWRGNALAHIWRNFEEQKFPDIAGGDQAFIEGFVLRPDILQQLFPKFFVSYKVDAQRTIPKGASVVVFHGNPRPHECKGWVESIWKIGGGSVLEFVSEQNLEADKLETNIRHAVSLDREWLQEAPAHNGAALLIGGGPSLRADLNEVRARQQGGAKIFALNNSWKWLKEQGVTADFHIMLDARPENAKFVPPDIPAFYASQCDPKVWELSPKAVLWNHLSASPLMGDNPKSTVMLAGGNTVGLNAMSLVYILGYRDIHLFGYDSSYDEERHHAYEQDLNSAERTLTVTYRDQDFFTAAWMAEQVAQFTELAPQLVRMGCTLTIHGSGLLPFVAHHFTDEDMAPVRTAADERSEAILDRIRDIKNPLCVEVGVFTGQLSRRLLEREDLTLFMVDSWKEHGLASEYALSGDFHGQLSQHDQDRFYEETRLVTGFAGLRGSIIRKTSIEAAQEAPDNSVDLVFLDADHTYEAVKADIAAWLPKVRSGGWLSGHDYENTEYPAWGVKKAVNELGRPVELGLNFTWFVQIP